MRAKARWVPHGHSTRVTLRNILKYCRCCEQPSAVTALQWDPTGMRLFSGDMLGNVAHTRVAREVEDKPTKRGLSSMFQSAVRSVKELSAKSASERILAEGSAVVQVC